MKAYSEDLRQKIVDALKRGTAKNEAATLFGVSLSSVKRFARMDRDGVSLAPKKPPGRPPKSNDITRRLLEADLADRPAATASERRRYLERMTGESMSDSTLRRLVRRLGHSRKKITPRLRGRRVPESGLAVYGLGGSLRQRSSARVCGRDGIEHLPARALRLASPRGQRAYCSVARNRGKNTTLLSSMTLCGMGPSMVVEGGTNGAVFEGYLREVLIPTLREGDVVVMDNLSVHKSETVRELIE